MESVTEITDRFVTLNEALSIYDIDKIIQEAGSSCSPFANQTSERDETRNAFCVGGPLSNECVGRYFREFFRTVKFGCPPNAHYLNDKNREMLDDLVYEDETDDVGTINFTNWSFGFNRKTEGYIILIRLIGKSDFGNCNHGTVHICFGNNAKTTKAATKLYSSHREELCKRLKNKKGHYFIIMKCTSDGAVNFNTFRDVTDEAFGVGKTGDTCMVLTSNKTEQVL